MRISGRLSAEPPTQAVQGQFQTMLDKVSLYHDLSATALSQDQLSKDATKGHPDSVALAYYSRATDVMHFDLLPVAAQIRDSYAQQLAPQLRAKTTPGPSTRPWCSPPASPC